MYGCDQSDQTEHYGTSGNGDECTNRLPGSSVCISRNGLDAYPRNIVPIFLWDDCLIFREMAGRFATALHPQLATGASQMVVDRVNG